MQNYKETIETGVIKKHTRAFKIEIMNQFKQVPQLTFFEEVIKELPDGTFTANAADNMTHELVNPAEVFPKVDLVTGQVTGSYTYADFQQMLSSLYIHSAMERDAAKAAQP